MIIDDRGFVLTPATLTRFLQTLQRVRVLTIGPAGEGPAAAGYATTWPVAPTLWVSGGLRPEMLDEASTRPGFFVGDTAVELVYRCVAEPSVALLRAPHPSEPLAIEASIRTEAFGTTAAVVGANRSREVRIGLGKLARVDDDRIYHTAPTEGGAGGGCILDEGGRAIGIHIGFKRQDDGGFLNYAHRLPRLLDELASEAPELLHEILEAHGLDAPSSASPDRVAPTEDPVTTGLRQAAAVLWGFDPSRLAAAGEVPAPPQAAWSLLMGEVDPLLDRSGAAVWQLKDTSRRRALESLGTPARIRAARSANDGDDAIPPAVRTQQAVIDRVLADPPHLDDIADDQLAVLAVAVDWFAAWIPGLPVAAALDQRRRRAELFLPLRQLAGSDFSGREHELAELEEWSGVASFEPLNAAGAFVLTGPGGTGKSAIVAHFLRERADRDDPVLPFAVLDFDRPGLRLTAPLTLASEIARQLDLQDALPDEAAWAAALAAAEGMLAAEADSDDDHAAELTSAMQSVAAALASQLDASRFANPQVPFVLFLDSFEEIQPAPGTAPDAVVAFLGALQQARPSLRVIVGARADVGELGLRDDGIHISVPLLDEASSRAILTARRVDARDHDAIVRVANGNPLALRLAADVSARFRERGEELPEDALTGTLVNGVLYRRILDHLWDAEVRELANPGLVLRVFDADVLRHVLAGPAGVGDLDEEQAKKLLNKLADVGSLVRREGNKVRHRADVRRLVLPLLEADDPQLVAGVEAAAIAYYEALPTPATWQRAELLYHLLRTVPDRDRWEAVWGDGLGSFFSTLDLDDLRTDDARSWLSSRLGGGGIAITAVVDEDRAYIAMRRLAEALATDSSREISHRLKDSYAVTRPAGPEFPYLQALAHLRREEWGDALTCLDGPARHPDRWMSLRYHFARAEALEHVAPPEAAAEELTRAIHILNRERPQALVLAVLAHRANLIDAPETEAEDRRFINEVLWSVGEKWGAPTEQPLVRYAGAAATPQEPDALWAALQVAGAARWQPDHVYAILEAFADRPAELERFAALVGRSSSEQSNPLSSLDVDPVASALIGLPDLGPDFWRRRYVTASPVVVEVLIALTLAALRPTIYRRFRAGPPGSEEAPLR